MATCLCQINVNNRIHTFLTWNLHTFSGWRAGSRHDQMLWSLRASASSGFHGNLAERDEQRSLENYNPKIDIILYIFYHYITQICYAYGLPEMFWQSAKKYGTNE